MRKITLLLSLMLLLFSVNSIAQDPIEDCDCDWNTDELVCVSFFGDVVEVHPCDIECGLFIEIEMFEEITIVNCDDLVFGCTDPVALNYNPEATANNGTCEYDNTGGCDCDWDTDELVCVDFGGGEIAQLHPCEIECYDWFAELNIVDCTDLVYGCTDPSALNYNPAATVNDGTCEYEVEEECDCDWDTAEVICVSFFGEIYEVHPCEIECGYYEEFLGEGFEIEIVDCGELVYGCTDPSALNYNPTATVNDGTCEYEVEEECDCDWETDEIICVSFDGQILEVHPCVLECEFEDGLFDLIEIVDCGEVVYGCTDPSALNYDAAATVNDGSCEYDIIDECDCDWTTDEWLCITVIDGELGNEFVFTVHACDLECGFVDLDEFGLEYEIMDCDGENPGDDDEEENEDDWTDVYDFDLDQYLGDQGELTELLEEIISDGEVDEDELYDLVDIFIDLNIFPNPVEGTDMGINITSSDEVSADLAILNSLGQLVYEDKLELEAGNNRMEIGVENLESGIYFTRIITSNGKLIQEKFIKQ
ncbi:MAG: T9SS type A sorting domain-containing protein [Flavobacteriales bacterium]